MRSFLFGAAILLTAASFAFASDIDRHASYNDGANASLQCKPFVGTDDNRSHCDDWCTEWLRDHQGAACDCSEGACVPDSKPAASSNPGQQGS